MCFHISLVLFFSILLQMSKCTSFRFNLLKIYYRSSQSVVGLANVESVSACGEFTESTKGLAFNFSGLRRLSNQNNMLKHSGNGTFFPRKSSRKHILDQVEEFFNCHALACPELGNMSTLINDCRFDYYTLYSNPVPPLNTTCIPEIGLFQFYKSAKNYSAAFKICVAESRGALAHVASEGRTNKLSDFLHSKFEDQVTKSRIAFIGLNFSWPEREFRTSEYESLRSFEYRAWAPGYPNKQGNESCVAIRLDRSWVTVDCAKALPFICEVYTSGNKTQIKASDVE